MTPRRPRRILSAAVAIGALLGLGIGFRTDVMLYLVPCAAGLLVCSPEGSTSPWRVRAAAAALFICTAVAVAWPILRTYSTGQSLWHVALLGLTTPYDSRDISRSSDLCTDFGDQYLDQ